PNSTRSRPSSCCWTRRGTPARTPRSCARSSSVPESCSPQTSPQGLAPPTSARRGCLLHSRQPAGGYSTTTLCPPGSTVSVVWNPRPVTDSTVTVTVTLCPAASEPDAGPPARPPAGAEAVMLNRTGPPSAVSVNDPVYGPLLADTSR